MPANPFVSGPAGAIAQLFDGGLGVGFGPIAVAFLSGLGIAPVVAAASANLAALGAGLVGTAAHQRYGNVHWPFAVRLAAPGALGAFAGAWAMASLADLGAAGPVTSAALVVLGAAIMWRFASDSHRSGPVRGGFTAPTGLVGGFVAAAGVGWGAVTTPVTLALSRLSPRQVVGSVAAARVAVSAAAVLGFWWALPASVTMVWPLVAALAIGGAVTAPAAAWLARRLPAPALGAAIGAAVMTLHLRTLLGSVSAGWPVTAAVYALPALALAAVVTNRYGRRPTSRAVASEPGPAEV